MTPKNIGRPSTSNVRRVAFTRSMQSDICLPFHCCKLSFISGKFWAFYAQFSIDPKYIARHSTSNVHGVTFTRSMIPSALGLPWPQGQPGPQSDINLIYTSKVICDVLCLNMYLYLSDTFQQGGHLV